jgi:hypothetical protein
MMSPRYTSGMRTTINLDQDVVEVARSLAATQGISLGAAISVLARRGISGTGKDERRYEESRFPSFTVAEDAPRFGTEDVRQALDDK